MSDFQREILSRLSISKKRFKHTIFRILQKPLPEGAVYAIREVDHSKQIPQDTWHYKDEAFQTLSQESFPAVYDPRVRNWYLGAIQKHELYWSDVYSFNPIGEAGLTVAYPIFNEKNGLIGVVGADLSLSNLSDFLTQQKISTSGKAFIVNTAGKILIPKEETDATVTAAYKLFTQKQEHNFLFNENGVKYLAHANFLPISAENKLIVLIIAPLNDFFGEIFKTLQETVLISVFILILSGLAIVYFSKRISHPIVQLTQEVDKIKHLDLESEKRVKSHIREISLLDASIAAMRVTLRSFGRYVPKEIVQKLMEQGQEIVLGGEKRALTVLFSDIADFTPIAESLPIEEIMTPLAVYFDSVSRILLESQGTIDKYIGDSVMAFWGAPSEVSEHEVRACTAALLCREALTRFNRERKRESKPEFLTRFGIHTGEVIVGNIGTTERMNYTVMGDVVNEAARLQQVNKIYHTSILISEEVYRKIGDQFLTRILDIVSVKGKKEKIKIYELVAKHHGEEAILPTPEQIELCTSFTQGYELYFQGKLEEAKKHFQMLNQKFPNDFPTQLYLERMH